MTLGFAFDAVVAGKDSWGRPVYMERRTAPLLWGLVQDYANHGWGELVILEGGRTLARQQELWDGYQKGLPGYNTAAFPGTGKHDKKGTAVDFGAPWDSSYKVGWQRLASIAPRWGFTNTEGANTKPRPEGWHWVCDPDKATASLVGAEFAGFDLEGLDDDMPLSDDDIKKIANAAAIAVLTGSFGDKDGVQRELRTVLNNIDRAATDGKGLVAGVDKRVADVQAAVLNGHGGDKIAQAVWDHPITRGDKDAQGRNIVTKARDLVGTSQLWVNQIITKLTAK